MSTSVFKSLTGEISLKHDAETFFERGATEGIKLFQVLFHFWLELTYWEKQKNSIKCFPLSHHFFFFSTRKQTKKKETPQK